MVRAAQICSQTGCYEFVTHEGRCTEHQRDHGWATSARVRPIGWAKIRKRVLRRDGRRCTVCGKRSPLVVDHLVAQAFGGSDNQTNLRTLCGTCHKAKTQDESLLAKRRSTLTVGEFTTEVEILVARWS